MTARGTIRTGVSRDRIPEAFRPVLELACEAVQSVDPGASLYVYGSVATGMARSPLSDVDLLPVGLPADAAADIGTVLSDRFADRCRGVELAAAQPGDFEGDSDAAYGGRVFLRHYCVHLAGPDPAAGLSEFPADARAARGFNGDIADHAERWRAELEAGADPAGLGRRLARKTLLAVTGLVSVHDATWTTDRVGAARRWAAIEPVFGDDIGRLLSWSGGTAEPHRHEVAAALDGVVAEVVRSFSASIGLWDTG